MTIVVTGSTGNVGAELIAQLAAAAQPVRAMTRRPNDARVPPGVEVVHGDCDDPESLDVAFRNADRAFLMSAQAIGSAEHPTHDLALVDAAKRAGVRYVVKLSVYSGDEHHDAIGDWHREAEAAVTGSELDWTLLRPGRFMSNALQWAAMIRQSNTVHIPFARRPTAAIAPSDVASVAALALTTGDHRHAVYQLSGPQVLTPIEELAILAEVVGRPLRAVEPTIDEVRAGMSRAGMPEPVVDSILAAVRDGKEGADVLPTVGDLLGRPPITFAEWAHDHAELFTTADHPVRRGE
jgi:uncharacterized protein YbjT (DUF2867 family)